MSDESDDAESGETDPDSGRAAPPAELLRRAISHVESLLERLEGPAAGGELVAAGAGTQSPEAARVRQDAQDEAAAIVRAAQADADRIRSEAASDAASEVESALQEADRIREEAARPHDDEASPPA